MPIPWAGDAPSYGFGPGPASWLPQPQSWASLSVAAQAGVDGSTLEFYRAALQARRTEHALADGPLTWLDAPAGVLAFRREAADGTALICALNLEQATVALPTSWGTTVVVSSQAATTALVIGGETAVWLRT